MWVQTSSWWVQTEVRAAVFEPQAAQPENPRPARYKLSHLETFPSESELATNVGSALPTLVRVHSLIPIGAQTLFACLKTVEISQGCCAK